MVIVLPSAAAPGGPPARDVVRAPGPATGTGGRGRYHRRVVSPSSRPADYLKRIAKLLVVLAAFAGVAAASLAAIAPRVGDLVSAHRSDHERISLKPLAERSYIYDSLGQQQGVMTNRDDPQNRSQVELSEIPDTVTESVLAAEDASFYRHNGINLRSILRAADANLESGGASQGGSTITQQVVKNSLVGDDQDLSRKLREAFLAIELEKQMEKDDILEYYLNSVYFGGGAYGVQAAAEYYFAKDVSELDWAQGALLASLIRSPNYYNPFNNPEVARERRRIVFSRLVATGKLTRDEVDFAESAPLPTTPNRPVPPYDYFVEEVKQQLLADPKFGLGATEAARNRTVFEGGIKVYTTFDPTMQAKALQARDETLPSNNGDATFDVVDPETGQVRKGTQAITSIDPRSGAVRVMVGGPGFDKEQLNLTLRQRPPGSTMKTFVMASLFEQGFVPADTVTTGSCVFKFPGDLEPTVKYTGRGGTITGVTESSSNCAYMALGQVATIPKVAEVANRVGIKSSLYMTDDRGQPTAPPNNLPLGTQAVTPLEMASAYGTFAADGVYHEPYLVERIEDRQGKVLYQHRAAPELVYDTQAARLVTQVLESNVISGTGTRARIDGGQRSAGKTGTTNDSTNVWFVGYTPELATAVWMGVPVGEISMYGNPELRGATGGRYPAATWGRFYSLHYTGRATVDFTDPVATRRGRSVGRIPFQTGGSSGTGSRSGTTTRRRTTGGGGGGQTTGTTAPAAAPERPFQPETPAAPAPPTPTGPPGGEPPGGD